MDKRWDVFKEYAQINDRLILVPEYKSEYIFGLVKQAKMEAQIGKPKSRLIVLDDVDSSEEFRKIGVKSNSSALSNIAYDGRHLNMTLIVTLHRVSSVDPPLKGQADTIIYYNPSNTKEEKIFLDEWSRGDVKTFKQTLRKTTDKKYNALVLLPDNKLGHLHEDHRMTEINL